MKKTFILALVVFIIFVSCDFAHSDDFERETKRIDNVVRIFMHHVGHYSLMVKDPETGRMNIELLNVLVYGDHYGRSGSTYIFVPDVPPDRPMFVEVAIVYHVVDIFFLDRHRGSISHMEAVFHIHSEKDVNGAGWDHGKSGSGQTIVVE